MYTYKIFEKNGKQVVSGSWLNTLKEAHENAKKSLHVVGEFAKIQDAKTQKTLVIVKLTNKGLVSQKA